MSQKSCAERVGQQLADTIETVKTLWELYKEDPEGTDDDLGRWDEFGLCFDYVEGGTDYNPENGYFRFQMSYGGPSDEFRFYADAGRDCHHIEYWFLDWFDGAHRVLDGTDKELMSEIWGSYFEPHAECMNLTA